MKNIFTNFLKLIDYNNENDDVVKKGANEKGTNEMVFCFKEDDNGDMKLHFVFDGDSEVSMVSASSYLDYLINDIKSRNLF